jgi:hypothetical protein
MSHVHFSEDNAFNETRVIHNLKHFLPSQQALKDFIHHNTLHAFQHQKFYDAIFTAGEIFGYSMHLKLEGYRGLYLNGRIRKDVLDRIIASKEGDRKNWEHDLFSRGMAGNKKSPHRTTS